MRTRQVAIIALSVTLLLVTGLAASAWAQADVQLLEGKFRSGQLIVIGEDEVVDHDLYASGGRVEVDGTIEGDLVAAAGEVVVRGTVTGNALLAGGQLSVPGEVQGTIRAAGGRVELVGEVMEDLVVAGGQVRIASAGQVGGDLVFAGGEVSADGDVGGNVLGRAGEYTLNGTVAGDEQVVVTEEAEPGPPGIGAQVVDALQRYVSLVLVAALLLAVARRPIQSGAERIRRQPLSSLGAGLLGIVGAVLGLVAVAIAVAVIAGLLGVIDLNTLAGLLGATGGLTVATLSVAFVAALVFIAQIVVGLWLGHLAIDDIGSWPRALGAAALGLAVVVLLSRIPFAGALVSVLVAILGIGGLVMAAWNRRRDRRAVRPPPPPQPATA